MRCSKASRSLNVGRIRCRYKGPRGECHGATHSLDLFRLSSRYAGYTKVEACIFQISVHLPRGRRILHLVFLHGIHRGHEHRWNPFSSLVCFFLIIYDYIHPQCTDVLSLHFNPNS